MSKEKNVAFLSYAREDLDVAQHLYAELARAGVTVWFDRVALLPGQHWKPAIIETIRTAKYFLALLSSNSVNKRGYVQKELREALEVLDEIPQTDIYLIPVRIDDCRPTHQRLEELQWVDLFPSFEEGVKRLLRALLPSNGMPGRLRSLEPVAAQGIQESAEQLTDALTPVAGKKRALRLLLNAARQTTDQDTKARIAGTVVRALFDASKPVRDLAASVLSEIGPAAIDVILAQTLWKIPGRTHGYDVAEKILSDMGARAIPVLVDKIDVDEPIITRAICDMPFSLVKEACIRLFLRERFTDRWREEIYRKMRFDPPFGRADWECRELETLLLSCLEHKAPLVRVLAAEWLADAYPDKAVSALERLLEDENKVERFDLDLSKRGWTVSQYAEAALGEARRLGEHRLPERGGRLD